MKTPNGKYKFGNGCKGVITVIYKNSKYRAADIVYETFIGGLKTGYHAYPRDSRYNNLVADNLFPSPLLSTDYIAEIQGVLNHSTW